MQCHPEDKECIGCSPSPEMTGPPVYRRESIGSEDNWNPAQSPDTFIGKLLWPSTERKASPRSSHCLEETPAMRNCPDQRLPRATFGKKTRESRDRSSSTEYYPSSVPTPKTGTEFGNTLNEGISCPYLPTYVLTVIGLSEQSALTLRDRCQWSELSMYSSVTLELGSHAKHGKTEEWKLTVKIPTVNSGAAIPASQVLSSMNFVAVSMSHTFSGGSIVIQSMWRSKDQASLYVQNPFGLQPTWTLNNGTQNSM